MPEITLEALAARMAAVEAQLAERKANLGGRTKKDWRRTVGMFAGSDFMKEVDKECEALREAERAEARRETPE